MDAPTFRATYPEFANATTYPDAQVQTWLTAATYRVDSSRWGGLTDTGVGLFTAHMLVLGQIAQRQASSGGAPGGNVGVLSSKSVDKVSASYDVAAATIKDAGHWNQTNYGVRFYELTLMFGAGGLQFGTGTTAEAADIGDLAGLGIYG